MHLEQTAAGADSQSHCPRQAAGYTPGLTAGWGWERSICRAAEEALDLEVDRRRFCLWVQPSGTRNKAHTAVLITVWAAGMQRPWAGPGAFALAVPPAWGTLSLAPLGWHPEHGREPVCPPHRGLSL